MKLTGAQAKSYLAQPDPKRPGVLLYGADAMRVALKRQAVIAALAGPEAEAEMRITRLSGADLRKDGSLALDAIKARGFFPGPRVVFVEEASDGCSKSLAHVLADWRDGDAFLVVSANALGARSTLRKCFESDKSAVAIGIYDDPPSRAEVEQSCQEAGLRLISSAALQDINALAQTLDPGDFRQFIEKLALYWHGKKEPLPPEAVALVAPLSSEAALDDILFTVAEGRAHNIQQILRRLRDQGVQPVTLCIGALRHFQTLLRIAAHPGGVSSGMAALRPPIFGPRRQKIERQAGAWGAVKLQQAVHLIVDLDLSLRAAGQTAPALALVERVLIKLAMMAARR